MMSSMRPLGRRFNGRLLWALRKREGLTQTDLGALLQNVDGTLISKWENYHEEPTPYRLEQIRKRWPNVDFAEPDPNALRPPIGMWTFDTNVWNPKTYQTAKLIFSSLPNEDGNYTTALLSNYAPYVWQGSRIIRDRKIEISLHADNGSHAFILVHSFIDDFIFEGQITIYEELSLRIGIFSAKPHESPHFLTSRYGGP